MGAIQFALRVEALGDQNATTSSRLWRWCESRHFFDDADTSDPDQLYRPGLLRWPRELAFSIDFRTAEARLGRQTFELRPTPEVLQAFWSDVPGVAACLQSVLSGQASATNVDLDKGDLAGETIFNGREAIELGPVAVDQGDGVFRYADSVRGVLGTSPRRHEPDGDHECFLTPHPTTLAGRLVQMIEVDLSGGYSTERVRFAGVLKKVLWRRSRIVLEVDNALSLLRGTKIYRNPWSPPEDWNGRVWRLEDVGSPDAGKSATEKRVLVQVDGGGAYSLRYKTASPLGVLLDLDDLPGSTFGGSPHDDDLENLQGKSIRELASSHRDAPSNVDAPATNTLPLQQEPGKLMLQLLLSTDNAGSPGGNDDEYDTGVGTIAGDIPAALVDKEGILRWNERVKHQPLDNFYLGRDGPEPVDLYPLLQRICRLYNSSLTQVRGGLISIARMEDGATLGTANAIGQLDVTSTEGLSADRGLHDTMDRVTVRYDGVPGAEAHVLNAEDVLKLERGPRGEHESLTLDATGMSSFDAAYNIALRYIQRFHAPITIFSFEVLGDVDYWPGDVVSLTHSALPSKGRLGVEEAICLITSRRERLDGSLPGDEGREGTHKIALVMLYVGELFDAVGYIAPTATVHSASLVSPGVYDIKVNANDYTKVGGPGLLADAEGFETTDAVQLVSEHWELVDGNGLVVSVDDTTIRVGNLSVAPVEGQILRVARYSLCSERQKETWAYISDADNELDGDEAKEYFS